MQPNFDEMTRSELKTYVLQHREDHEALRALMRRRSPDSEATWYDFEPSEDEESVMEILQRKISSGEAPSL